MAMTATPVFIQAPKITPQSFIQGTDVPGNPGKTIFTAGPNGSKRASIYSRAARATYLPVCLSTMMVRGISFWKAVTR